MNMNKSTEKKLRRTIKTPPMDVVPMVDAMEAWGKINRGSNFIEHKCARRFWQILILAFMGCLGYWAYDIHKQYTLFNQQALCSAVVMQKQQDATPAAVSSAVSASAKSVSAKADASVEAVIPADKGPSGGESHPSLKLVNKPLNPIVIADLKMDAIRDSFDTAEENFIESQSGQEFSKKNTPLFQTSTPTVTQEQAPFKIQSTPQDIQQWLLHQHIKGVAYRDFESCFIMNSKIFHLNEVVQPEYNLVWSDIDPVDKKLFFSDDAGNLYSINY